jgi:hypothetical protein
MLNAGHALSESSKLRKSTRGRRRRAQVARRRNIVAKSAQVVSSDSLHGRIGRIEGLKDCVCGAPHHIRLSAVSASTARLCQCFQRRLLASLLRFRYERPTNHSHFCMLINLELACEACNNACLLTGSRLSENPMVFLLGHTRLWARHLRSQTTTSPQAFLNTTAEVLDNAGPGMSLLSCVRAGKFLCIQTSPGYLQNLV